MLDICEDESNNKDAIKKRTFSPFHDQSGNTPGVSRKMSMDTQKGKSKSKVRKKAILINVNGFE